MVCPCAQCGGGRSAGPAALQGAGRHQHADALRVWVSFQILTSRKRSYALAHNVEVGVVQDQLHYKALEGTNVQMPFVFG